MAPRKKPPRVLTPEEWTCKWCGNIAKRHCQHKECRWYPCPNVRCRVVTILDLVLIDNVWKWKTRWVKRDAKYSSE